METALCPQSVARDMNKEHQMRDRLLCGLLLLTLVAGCDSNCPVGVLPRDGSTDTRHDLGVVSREGSVDAAPRDGSTGAGWLVTIGESGAESIGAVVVDPAGNLVVAGAFSGTVSFDSTTLTGTAADNTFVGKLDPTGKWLWAVRLDGYAVTESGDYDGLAVDSSGNIYYAGQFEGSATFGSTKLSAKGSTDVFVVKLNTDGNVLWAISAGGPGQDLADAIAVGNDGAITLGGRFSETATFGSTSLTSRGARDIFVARLDTAGSFSWVVQAGSDSLESSEWLYHVLVDGGGNSYLAGGAGAKASFGTLTLTDSSGTYFPPSPVLAFIAKLDASGTFQWVTSPAGAMMATSLARDGAGNLYTVSNFPLNWSSFTSGRSFAFVSKLSETNGKISWSTILPSDRVAWGNRVIVDGNGRTTVAGYYSGTMFLGLTTISTKGTNPSPFIARLDLSGKVISGEQIQTSGISTALGLARDSGGNTYVSGAFMGTASFGGMTRTSKGTTKQDGFLWNKGPDQQ
jgi:hypothetical protein